MYTYICIYKYTIYKYTKIYNIQKKEVIAGCSYNRDKGTLDYKDHPLKVWNHGN